MRIKQLRKIFSMISIILHALFLILLFYLQPIVELFLHFYSNFLDVRSRDRNERIFMFRSNLNDLPIGVLALLFLSVISLMKYVCVCVSMYTVISAMILDIYIYIYRVRGCNSKHLRIFGLQIKIKSI